MNAHQFAEKWRKSTLKESAGYIPHFEDICRLVGHETPTDADSSGSRQGRGGVGPAANPPEWSLKGAELEKRTLTNLYNERARPGCASRTSGWTRRCSRHTAGTPGISDGEVLARLLALDLEREAV